MLTTSRLKRGLKMNSTIKPILKTCKTCLFQRYIFSHGNCKNCATLLKLRNTPKQVTLKQTADGKTAKVFKIAPMSKNRAEQLKDYRKKRDEFLKGKTCEFPGCTSNLVELHHVKGRVGSLLTDVRYFKALCRRHHRFAEENPLEALKMGVSVSRLAK